MTRRWVGGAIGRAGKGQMSPSWAIAVRALVHKSLWPSKLIKDMCPFLSFRLAESVL